MNHRGLQTIPDSPALWTPALQRQLALMVCWWEGWSLSRMAREHGISRSRVAAILGQVGCCAGHRPDRTWDRSDSRRGAPAAQAARARALLLHPKASRLTVRQRAAVAWTALGLSSRDTARRMGVTAQRVRSALTAAQMRLAQHPHRPRTEDASFIDDTSVPTLLWDGCLQSLVGQGPASQEIHDAD